MADDRHVQRRGRAGRSPFRDQPGKLNYLLNVRGDRRERDARRPRFAKPDPDAWPRLAPGTEIVSTQAGLGTLLGRYVATVSRWFNGHEQIPSLDLATICRIFDADELSCRTDTFHDFKQRCAGNLAFGAMLPRGEWRRLLTQAELGRLRVLLEDPAGDPYTSGTENRRYASTRSSDDDAPLPNVGQHEPFWIGVPSPSDEEGAPLWAGWSLMLLNEDRGRDGFKSLLPGDAERGPVGNHREWEGPPNCDHIYLQ